MKLSLRCQFSSCFALLVACLAISAIQAATVSLAPARDTTIIQATDPNAQLANGRGDLFSGRTNQDGQAAATTSIRRSLIYFDIASAVPNWATITSVSLTMRNVMGNNGDQLTTLHRALQSWGEGTSYQSGGQGSAATQDDATWLYRYYNEVAPATSPTWTTPGGDFDPAASGSTTVLNGAAGQLFTWSGPGMVSGVQQWLANPAGNFGWLIRGNESVGQTSKRLNGRTLNNVGDVAPVLSISYVPEPASCLLLVLGIAAMLAFRPATR